MTASRDSTARNDTVAAISAPPAAAPHRPPRLNQPWMPDMIGAVPGALDHGRLGVHADVETAHRDAGEQRRGQQGFVAGGGAQQRQRHRAREAGDDNGAHAAEPRDQRAGERHGQDGTDGEAQHDGGEAGIGQAQRQLHARDLRGPDAHAGAAGPEHEVDRPPRRDGAGADRRGGQDQCVSVWNVLPTIIQPSFSRASVR